MDAKSGISCFTKWGTMYVLLLPIILAMAVMGSSLARQTNQNNSMQRHGNISIRSVTVNKVTSQLAEGKVNKSAVIGTAVVLDCPHHIYDLAVWNVYLHNGMWCHLSYRTDEWQESKNCSEDTNWLSRPEHLPSLQIKSAQISNEGLYRCSISDTNGTFFFSYYLTVLVPPKVSLSYNVNGNPMCKATAGKPAAQISWIPAGDYKTKPEVSLKGTETIISEYYVTNATQDDIACIVSHPAWEKSHVFNLSLAMNNAGRTDLTRILYSSLICLLGIFMLLLFIYLWRVFRGRKTDVTVLKIPEAISTRLSFQESDTQPYATFVQVENVIYDKASDFSPGFSSST
uniref:Immunoglobulin domain-containing protein n=2 Tax=Anolis carolinensis TaxID=28377 RepID=R4GC32_ANOCA|nr:PREDICTED: cell surface glycoprotein CD200 receptor 1 [Anolis carolinensis]|eukprot:XP_008106066.1 PREDICTED: cell surface glycoprotein CD200 receptor 1 [Anolis carolinensis]